jgi:hypothetical protein
MPCYSPANVDRQRGDGVFDLSIVPGTAITPWVTSREAVSRSISSTTRKDRRCHRRRLRWSRLQRELLQHFDIRFNYLFALTNGRYSVSAAP